MARWVEVGEAEELPDGGRLCVAVEGQPLVLFNIDGELLGVRNVCPHAGMPLDDGDVSGTVITCPYHGYAYDLRTGRNVDFDDLPADTYPVRRAGDRIEVDLDPPAPSA